MSEHCFQVLRETELGSVAKPVSIPTRCFITCVPCPVDLGSNCTEKHGQEQHLCRKENPSGLWHLLLFSVSASDLQMWTFAVNWVNWFERFLFRIEMISQFRLESLRLLLSKSSSFKASELRAQAFCSSFPKIWKAEVAMFPPCHQRGHFLRFSAALRILEAGLLTMSAATLCPATCSATVDGSSWPCRYHGNGCKVNITNTDASRFSAWCFSSWNPKVIS